MYIHRRIERPENLFVVDVHIGITRSVHPSISLRILSRRSLDTSVQLRNLNLNHMYAVRVRAENAFGVSDPSQPVTSRLLTRSECSKREGRRKSICFLDEERRVEDEPITKTRRPMTSSYDDYAGE